MATVTKKRRKKVSRKTIKKVVTQVFTEMHSQPPSRIYAKSGVALYMRKPDGKTVDLVYGLNGKRIYVELKATKGTQNYRDLKSMIRSSRIEPLVMSRGGVVLGKRKTLKKDSVWSGKKRSAAKKKSVR
ncbi:MAG TPA: hypothetical protein VFJ43_10210, partial [Bacteroidia bacterium]|nr:hypothetical protein [Bacteroidia bacterium]